MSERTRAVLCLLVCALLWSTGGVLIKGVDVHPLALSGTRSAIATLFMWAVLRRPRFTWSRTQIAGALAYGVTVLLYVSAVKLTTAANAILLQYTAPIYIALFGAFFLHEKATWIDWLSIVITLGGMALFFREGLASKNLVGDLLALASGLTFAFMNMLLRKQKAGSPLESVLLGNALAAAIGLPFLSRGLPTLQGWGSLLLLGVFQLGLSYVLYSMAIKHVTAMEGVLFSTLEPIINPIWVMLLIGERPSAWAVVGGALVLSAVAGRGVLLALRSNGRPRAKAATALPEEIETA
jgi:drug/metabolite transporter (DMT)-like permease